MPTYQYACTECGAQMEVVQSFSDDSLTVCPECEGRLRKVYSAVGIVFKGSGFYRTDSGTPSNGSTLTGANSGESKGGTSSDSASPAKSASSDSGSASPSSSSATSTASSGSSTTAAAAG
ncbi:FmdB family transcriptional regulator [Nocardiopsis sp. CNR-923]|uniref:FmdB family zinc ribbon protein n=1 Tax=Nocardiopsis sp. CNR-923 TaxID=1904965 RepID=UPI000961BFA9|nr:FmdB family zinc ribbon protein [Nocardiopsis sp. CNR-923]OLT27226.1 FmdB family transcriptional regulator [Nocardiopsis sp. CNR-923]